MNKFQIKLFGVAGVIVDNNLNAHFKTSKVRDLLAYLLLHQAEPIPRDQVIRDLWQNDNSANERNRLSVTAYMLRQCLENCKIPNDIIRAERDLIWIDPRDTTVDTDEFLQLYQKGNSNLNLQSEHWQQAFNLYSGSLLAGCTDLWIEPFRNMHRQAFLKITSHLATNAVRDGDFATAFTFLKRAIDIEPNSGQILSLLLRWGSSAGETDLARQAAFALRRIWNNAIETQYPDLLTIMQSVLPPSELDQIECPTLSTCVVDAEFAPQLATYAREMGLEIGKTGDYAIAANPIIAQSLAKRIQTNNPQARILIAIQIMKRNEPISKWVRNYHRTVKPGETWVTRGAGAVLLDHDETTQLQVRENRKCYRILA